MVRDIAWKDLPSIPQYRNQQCYLDNNLWLVYNPGLLSSILLSITFPSSGFITAVESQDDKTFPFTIGQIYHPRSTLSARLAFLGPKGLDFHYGFSRLLAHLVSKVGERGAVQVLAEVPKNQSEEKILYQSGFRAYAEQQIWKLPRRIPYGTDKIAWVPFSGRERAQVGSLMQRTLPNKVQRVEPPPSLPNDQGLVSWKDGNVVGCASIQFGPKGILLDLVLDSGLEEVDDYLSALFFHLPYRNTRDVFLRIRSYQERLASSVERTGATPGPEQRAVVKNLAVPYNAKQTFQVQGFEKQPDITTLISNLEIKH
jgi:hypothetical protein